MPIYEFVAVNSNGEEYRDFLTARNEEELERFLSLRGFSLVRAKRYREVGTPNKNPVNARNLSLAFRQMSSLLQAGMPIAEVLRVVSAQFAPPLGDILDAVYTDVASGTYTLDRALERHPAIPRHVVGTVEAAINSGNLAGALRQLADNLGKAAYFRGLAVSAMTYPAIILVMAVLLTVGMMVFIVPSMLSSLADIAGPNAALPLPTRILLLLSRLMTNPLFLLASFTLLGGSGYALLSAWRADGEQRAFLEGMILRTPLMGELFAKSQMIGIARLISNMLSSGLRLPAALALTERATGSRLYREALRGIREMVEGGLPIHVAFQRYPHLFSHLFRSMVEIGSGSSDVDRMLAEVARIYEEEYEARLKGLSAVLEPVMLVVVGLVIGGIMLAVLLPYFSTLSSLGG